VNSSWSFERECIEAPRTFASASRRRAPSWSGPWR